MWNFNAIAYFLSICKGESEAHKTIIIVEADLKTIIAVHSVQDI